MKDLIIHLNVSKHCTERLQIAARLAHAFEARLSAIFTNAPCENGVPDLGPAGAKSPQIAQIELRDRLMAEFNQLRTKAVAADWVDLDGDIAAKLSYLARYADLAIMGQTDPDERLPHAEYDVPERVATSSGRPVLVIPYAGSFASLGQRVLIAWNGSAQAARAVGDAMPFLKKAQKITILTINPATVNGERDRPGERLIAHLERCTLKAKARELKAHELTVNDVSVDDIILSQAADEDADLIVMGAYGHARMNETIFGGATRGLFQHMTVPTFMSH